MIRGDEIRQVVREHYAGGTATGCCADTDCCGGTAEAGLQGFIGPSLGCGSPLAYAALQSGETVVDLGAGAGGGGLRAAPPGGTTRRGHWGGKTPGEIAEARHNP